MECNKKRIFVTIILSVALIFANSVVFAHSGRTDSNGGHRDNKNRSGLGSYHYHCGGYPAHLHTNGVCPYSSSLSSSSSNIETTPLRSTTVDATEIVINESLTNITVGESKRLTVTISPTDTTDKNISWKSSDENIAVITSSGELIARKSGVVEIIASTVNGRECSMKIVVENVKEENNEIDNTTNTTSEDSDPVAGIVGLGLLGGGYWGYKKYKKSKQ